MRYELCVKGFPLSVGAEEIKGLFSTCGLVRSVEMDIVDYGGFFLGMARVEMGSEEEAQRSLRLLHQVTWGGRPLLLFRIPQPSCLQEPVLATVTS
jgi:RNA recognition motif-containing protein